MLSTSSDWTAESEKTVFSTVTMQSQDTARCHCSEGRGKGKNSKVRKGEQQAANGSRWGKKSQYLKTKQTQHLPDSMYVWGGQFAVPSAQCLA